MKDKQEIVYQDKEITTLGGGCFWCLEAIYAQLQGILSVDSGYAGGEVLNPTYEQVCSGATGHAEVVQVVFDPRVITFSQMLEVFFSVHDPTTLNRQGADIGSQYRSVIFYHSPQQEAVAKQVMNEISSSGLWDKPLVTQLLPFQAFYKAEAYHHQYFSRNPNQAYCQAVIQPKVAKFRRQHLDKLIKSP